MRTVRRTAEYDAYGGVDHVRLVQVPVVEPEPGDVAIEVIAAGVSHLDVYVREGRFQRVIPLAFPAQEGVSFAGIVRAKGREVHGLAVGAAVLGHDPAHGAHADRVVVPAGAVVPKPDLVTWEVAGALYLPGLTSYTIVQSLRPGAGDVVVVTAPADGVGHLESQLLRLAGATVIGVVGEENRDYLRSIGVVPVAYGDGVAERVREAARGRPVTAVIDNYGDYAALAEELGVRPPRFVSSDRRREIEIRWYTAPGDDGEAALHLRDLAELVATWNIRVLVSGFYGLDDLPQALLDVDARHNRGVVVVGMHTAARSSEYRRGKARSLYEHR